MGIVVISMIFVDIKGYPETSLIPIGRNVDMEPVECV